MERPEAGVLRGYAPEQMVDRAHPRRGPLHPRVDLHARYGDGEVEVLRAGGFECHDDDPRQPTVEQVYDGPVDYARDFMVWNVTKDGVRTRIAVPNPESYPLPPLQEKQISAGKDRYQTPEWVLDGFPDEVDAVAKKIYADFNEEHGTDYEFQLKK